MKRLIISISAALVCLTGFAQSFDMSDEGGVAPDKGYQVFNFEITADFGWGYHILMDDGSQDPFLTSTSFGRSKEIFFNLGQIELRPVKPVSLTVGIDLNWDNYRLKKGEYLWVPGTNQDVTIGNASDYSYTVKKSILRSFGFDAPVMLRFHLGDVCIAGGVVGEYNLPGRTKFVGRDASGKKVKNPDELRTTDIQSNPLTYSFRASVSYSGLGLYAKYSPASQFVAGHGPQFSYTTVGILLGM